MVNCGIIVRKINIIKSMNSTTYNWYSTLIRPTWSPPAWLFGPVWSLLYFIIAITYGTILYKVYKGELSRTVMIPLFLNLFFNFIFTYIQFGLKNNLLASIDIVLVLVTLVWLIGVVYPHVKWAALLNIPYLLWVSFATVLQLTITYLNIGK